MRIGSRCTFLAAALLAGAGAGATEMSYMPLNPSFGGNPLNGPALLSSAQATKKFKEESGLGASSLLNKSPLQTFNETLERSILSQLSSSAASKLMNSSGQLVPGTLETGNFRINIVDTGNGSLQVTSTDKVTGASSSFEVSK